MALAHRTQRRLYNWAIYTLVGGAIGAIYALSIGGHPKFGFPIGCAIAGGPIGFEMLFVQQPVGAWLRGLPLLAFIIISTLIWTLILAVILRIAPRLLGLQEAHEEAHRGTAFLQKDIVFSLAVAFVMNAVLRIRSLVGGRVLMNFLLDAITLPPEAKAQYMGEAVLRGKAKSLKVYALSRGSCPTCRANLPPD